MRFWLILCVGVLLLYSCWDRSVAYRYRLTVEVETPSGLRTGSSVIEIASEYDPPSPLTGSGLCSTDAGGHRSITPMRQVVRGEAVAVDLGDGRTVYALLTAPNARGASDYAARAYLVHRLERLPGCPDLTGERRRIERMRDHDGPLEVPNDPRHTSALFPTLALFGDPRDPRTLRVLDRRDLARGLGPGHRLRRILVEITDDPVTTGIEDRLPWLDAARGFLRPYGGAPDFVAEPERVLTDWSFRSPQPD